MAILVLLFPARLLVSKLPLIILEGGQILTDVGWRASSD